MKTLIDGLNGLSYSDLKRKHIGITDSDRIEQYDQLAIDFMKSIFNLDNSEFLITNESSLSDFASCNLSEDLYGKTTSLNEIYAIGRKNTVTKIKTLYGIDVDEYDWLIDIFGKIKQRKN